jgi:hypothetical protein
VEAAPDRLAGLDAVSERVFVGAAHAGIGSEPDALFQSELHEPPRLNGGGRTGTGGSTLLLRRPAEQGDQRRVRGRRCRAGAPLEAAAGAGRAGGRRLVHLARRSGTRRSGGTRSLQLRSEQRTAHVRLRRQRGQCGAGRPPRHPPGRGGATCSGGCLHHRRGSAMRSGARGGSAAGRSSKHRRHRYIDARIPDSAVTITKNPIST